MHGDEQWGEGQADDYQNALTAACEKLARCEWIERRENVIALGPSGTSKTHAALGLELAACQKGTPVGFVTGASLVYELMEAMDEECLHRLQSPLAKV